MTGKQLYEQAVVLLGMETEQVVYLEPLVLGCINQMLNDRLYEQNALQRAQGGDVQHMLATAPALESLEDEVPYEEMFVRECFPYGLAALLVAEDDRTMFNWLMSEYERRAAYYAPCTLTDMQEMEE
ncbi:MAG: hypothetical protein Q4P20_02025 [Eubacteriales bacterium]|nr:hypothetical protein [Eubacteriales bacterium]